jgi:hypothetical protein
MLVCRQGTPGATANLLATAGQAVFRAGGNDALGEAALYLCISGDMRSFANGVLLDGHHDMLSAIHLFAASRIAAGSLATDDMRLRTTVGRLDEMDALRHSAGT